MFASFKSYFRRSTGKTSENKKNQSSLILAAFIGILEDVLFWKKTWISLSFIFILNILFCVCVYRQISFLKFIISVCIATICIDAFEAWLKHKHRTNCLKRLADHEGNRLKTVAAQMKQWMAAKWIDLLYIRENNHTKAFLLLNIILGLLFLMAKYINGYTILYFVCMFICISYKIVLPLIRTFRNYQHDLESECEYEGLIPEVSDLDIKLLSIEPEHNQTIDEKQSLDYWKPVDVPLEEASDSSENSSSLATSFSMDKIQTLERDMETSDSSGDEYMPLDKTNKPLLQSTLEVVEPATTWRSSAYNAFWNLTGAMTNILQAPSETNKRKRISSIDSSDGFEMIDKKDFM